MIKLRRSRFAFGAATVLAASALLAGCATDTAAPEETNAAGDCSVEGLRVAFPGPLKSNPTLQVMAAGFVAGAESVGMEPIVSLVNDADPQNVLSVGRQAIAQEVDGLVFPPYDPSLMAFVDDAVAADIPIVLTHSEVAEADSQGAIANFHPDPTQYGAAVALTIGEAIGGTGTVAVTVSSFNQVENDAAASFKAEMEASFPDVVVLDPIEEGFDPAQAISKAVSIIQANPGIVGAFSTTGGGAVTWDGAATQSGTQLAIAGMDYTRPNLDLVRDGKVTALVAQPIFEEFEAGAQAIAAYLCGEEIEYSNPMPSEIITIDNVDEYYALLEENGL